MLPHLKNLITSLECYPVFRMLLDVWNKQAKISTPEYNGAQIKSHTFSSYFWNVIFVMLLYFWNVISSLEYYYIFGILLNLWIMTTSLEYD